MIVLSCALLCCDTCVVVVYFTALHCDMYFDLVVLVFYVRCDLRRLERDSLLMFLTKAT